MTGLGRFRDEIAALIDDRLYPMDWIEARIAEGSIMLMENDAAIIGVERRHYPGGAVELHGLFAAGELPGVLNLIDEACEAARAAGCTMATIASRPGWARILESRGFKMTQQTITKDLH